MIISDKQKEEFAKDERVILVSNLLYSEQTILLKTMAIRISLSILVTSIFVYIVIPLLIGMLKKGTHGSHSAVSKLKANRIKFKCDQELVCGYDGETLIDKKFDIKLLEKIKYFLG